LIEEAGKNKDRPTPRLVGRPSAGSENVLQLQSCHNKQWPAKSSTHTVCVLLAAKERAQCISAPDMM